MSANYQSQPPALIRWQWLEPRDAILPIGAVELGDGHILYGAGIDTADIDAITVGMGARHVEGLDTAMGAEGMFGGAGVKSIGSQCVHALQQPEPGFRHDEVQIGELGTNRAVAFDNLNYGGGLDLEAHLAAMAAAGVRDPIVHCLVHGPIRVLPKTRCRKN